MREAHFHIKPSHLMGAQLGMEIFDMKIPFYSRQFSCLMGAQPGMKVSCETAFGAPMQQSCGYARRPAIR